VVTTCPVGPTRCANQEAMDPPPPPDFEALPTANYTTLLQMTNSARVKQFGKCCKSPGRLSAAIVEQVIAAYRPRRCRRDTPHVAFCAMGCPTRRFELRIFWFSPHYGPLLLPLFRTEKTYNSSLNKLKIVK